MTHRAQCAQLHARPALYGLKPSYGEAVTFLRGYDLATDGGALRGFTEWLVVRSGHRTSLAWPALALRTALAVPPDASFSAGALTEEQDRAAFDALFTLLDEFFAATQSPMALARMYSDYRALMED
ncbi:hypothetical protein [Streptomyces sp. RFCAC02]|uniref:hypothetical protein n=1 Tax=Streptomyces sp. RFCAC02 TaxID=2499143 RepID=UPI001020DC8A|nr:hypothetical protein [Streptomyces sp. RFCAC02]